MSAPAVRRLAELRKADAAEVGGKAAGLGELIATGARVPDGLVLTVAAGSLPADERGSLITAGVADLGSGPFAVRSSGIAEDGAEHSFAGMFETILDVPANGLAAAADRVLASAQAARANGVWTRGQRPDGGDRPAHGRTGRGGRRPHRESHHRGSTVDCVISAVRGIGEPIGIRCSQRRRVAGRFRCRDGAAPGGARDRPATRPCSWPGRRGGSRPSWASRRTSSGRSMPAARSGSCRRDR